MAPGPNKPLFHGLPLELPAASGGAANFATEHQHAIAAINSTAPKRGATNAKRAHWRPDLNIPARGALDLSADKEQGTLSHSTGQSVTLLCGAVTNSSTVSRPRSPSVRTAPSDRRAWSLAPSP